MALSVCNVKVSILSDKLEDQIGQNRKVGQNVVHETWKTIFKLYSLDLIEIIFRYLHFNPSSWVSISDNFLSVERVSCFRCGLFDHFFGLCRAYLPGSGVNHDQEGGSPSVRLLHCTSEWLTTTITPNVGNLRA